MKKALLALMVLLMSMMMVFANGAAETAETAAATDPGTDGPFTKYETPVEISFSKIRRPNASFPEGQSVEDNTLLDMLREKLNIDVKIAWESVREDYNNKLALNIASGDIADAFIITDYLTFREMAENGMLADLTYGIEHCSSEYVSGTLNSFNGKNFEPMTIDGKIYGIPQANIGYGHNVLFLRKDWLDKLGLEVPKTLEDLKHVLREFMEKDPGNNGPGNTIGLAIHATDPLNGYGNKYGAEPLALAMGAYPRQWMKDENGNAYYGSTAPEMKEALRVMADMYKEGLIDRQFLTRIGTGETDAIIDSGMCGAWFAPWWGFNTDLYGNNPDAELIAVNCPLDSEGYFSYLTPSPVGDILAVSADFEHPEALMKLISQEYEWYRGFDQEGYQKLQDELFSKNVDREACFPTSSFNLDYNDVVPVLGKLVKNYVENGVLDVKPTTTEYDINQAKSAKKYADGINDPTVEVGKGGFKAYYRRYIASNILDAPETRPVYSAYYFTTESSPLLKPTLDKLEQTMVLKIITGEKPVDYFDEFVEQWNKLGGADLTAEVQKML